MLLAPCPPGHIDPNCCWQAFCRSWRIASPVLSHSCMVITYGYQIGVCSILMGLCMGFLCVRPQNLTCNVHESTLRRCRAGWRMTVCLFVYAVGFGLFSFSWGLPQACKIISGAGARVSKDAQGHVMASTAPFSLGSAVIVIARAYFNHTRISPS